MYNVTIMGKREKGLKIENFLSAIVNPKYPIAINKQPNNDQRQEIIIPTRARARKKNKIISTIERAEKLGNPSPIVNMINIKKVRKLIPRASHLK